MFSHPLDPQGNLESQAGDHFCITERMDAQQVRLLPKVTPLVKGSSKSWNTEKPRLIKKEMKLRSLCRKWAVFLGGALERGRGKAKTLLVWISMSSKINFCWPAAARGVCLSPCLFLHAGNCWKPVQNYLTWDMVKPVDQGRRSTGDPQEI